MEAAYAVRPIWPSEAVVDVVDVVFTITPRWPPASGSFAAISAAASVITVKVPKPG